MRKLIGCLLICALVMSVSFSCFAKDLKVGYVNVLKVLNDYEKTKVYDAKLEKKLEAAEKQLTSKKEAIEKSRSKLSLLKEGDREKEEEKIRKQVIEFQELNRKAFIDAKKERDEKMKEIATDVNKVVTEYAKKNGFTLVINQAAILYGDSVMDITPEILKIANQNYKGR